ncbi:hypothetical protein ACWGJ6_23345 [Streptomyces canus]
MSDPAQFGAPGCACRPFTADPPRYLQPGDSVDRDASWQRGANCPYHAPEPDRDEDAGSGWTQLEARAFNAVQPALRQAGEWLPLSARRAVAKAVLAVVQPEFEKYRDVIRVVTGEMQAAERKVARVQALIDEEPVAVGTHLLDEALDTGPTVREAVTDDRAHWNTKYAGETP